MTGKTIRQGIVAWVVIALVVVLAFPWAKRGIDRCRLAGLWHVSGSLADWRFSMDGTFAEESLFTAKGNYELLSGRRLRIKHPVGTAATYRYSFDKDGLQLEGCDGNAFSFRLTARD